MPHDKALSGETLLFFPVSHRDQGGYLKNQLLFFDDVRLVAPALTRKRAWQVDESIYGPLEDAGLLAESSFSDVLDLSFMDRALEDAMKDQTSMQRFMLGQMWEKVCADAALGGEGTSMDFLTPTAFALLYNSALRQDPKTGALLSPSTDNPQYAENARKMWYAASDLASIAQVIESDSHQVGMDTSLVPMDEYLDFRRQNRTAHRRYMNSVRGFFEQVSASPEVRRPHLIAERRTEIREYAAELNKATIRSMAQPTSLIFAIAGVAWSACTLDPTGALIGTTSLLAGAVPQRDNGTYSYLFAASKLRG